eukprot:CAMPEP_0184558722 /NCGR_PEP_ID=MMETSP0199_2-20130426/46056_1 /TAXON_ID=1112570 /ORGANISM="Thraustochytrium sp., Strain LLF1b" /LENGTH=495 /DNA_ID=CAMNT_0026955989 /DNA_START=89 /DNA_END=1579 /DNA_ORIENTATION=-
MANYDAPLAEDVEIRNTELFSAICLKADTAKFAGGAAAPAAAAAGDDDLDLDDDLFGDDDEEDVAAMEALNAKMAAEKAARKAGQGKGVCLFWFLASQSNHRLFPVACCFRIPFLATRTMSIPSAEELKTPAGMGKLTGFLASRSYVSGYAPSQADVELLNLLSGVEVDPKKAAHVARFLKHMNAFTEAERAAWPAAGEAAPAAAAEEEDLDLDDDLFGDDDEEDVAAMEALNAKMAAEKAARKAGQGKGDARFDDDLFGDDDEEDVAAMEALNAKMAAEKAARKAGQGKGERSLIVLEIKPFSAETDLEMIAKGLKTYEHEGIQNWGQQHKLLPVAFGIKKLAISAVVYDDLMGIDGLTDIIEEKYGDHVQSVDDEEDVAAMEALNAKMAAEKAARKAGQGKGERSLIVLEIKPFSAETDLEMIAKGLKTYEHEGIQNWGAQHKLLPVAFGIKKLAISAVVYDDLMGIDGLTDIIEEKYGDHVQSVDCQAMSKV